MTSAELQPQSEPPELSKIYRDARRRNLLFWFLGIAWAVSILGLGFFFTYTTIQLRRQLSEMGDITQRTSFVVALSIQDKQSEGSVTSAERQFLNDTLKLLSEKSARYPEQVALLANRSYSNANDRLLHGKNVDRSNFYDAARLYKKFLELRRHDKFAMHRLALALHYAGHNNEALGVLRMEIKEYNAVQQPDDSRDIGQMWAINQMGLVHLQRREYEAAIQNFQRAREFAKKLERHPKEKEERWKERKNQIDGGILENVGLVKIKQEKWDEAFNNTEDVLKITDQTHWNWIIRAIAANKLGQRSIAQSAYENWRTKSVPTDRALMSFYLPRTLRVYIENSP
jgi:tetratricopeptide (TPR) repeat protein